MWGNNTEVSKKLLETWRGLSLSEKPAGNACGMWGIMQSYALLRTPAWPEITGSPELVVTVQTL